MGKRSNFERRAADFYPTPRKAAEPLIAFLQRDGIRYFAEPAAGEGHLIRHLESFGLKCVWASDIRAGLGVPQCDALAKSHFGPIGAIGADARALAASIICTNPPYRDTEGSDRNRALLNKLVRHLAAIAPTWLLVEADWAQTWQAAPLMASCSDIVAIGRVKWIEGSKDTGKQNFAWLRFDARWRDGPRFHWLGRAPQSTAPEAVRCFQDCAQCGQPQAMARRCTGRCGRQMVVCSNLPE
jgi:hypothetical protein